MLRVVLLAFVFLLYGFVSSTTSIVDPLKPTLWRTNDFLHFAKVERESNKTIVDALLRFGQVSTSMVDYHTELYNRRYGIRWYTFQSKKSEPIKFEMIFNSLAMGLQSLHEYVSFLHRGQYSVLARKTAQMACFYGQLLHQSMTKSFRSLFKREGQILLKKQDEARTLCLKNPTKTNMRDYLNSTIATADKMFPLCYHFFPIYYGILKEALKMQIALFEICWKVMDDIGVDLLDCSKYAEEMIVEQHFPRFNTYLLCKWNNNEITGDTAFSYLSFKYASMLIDFLNSDEIPTDQFFRIYLLQNDYLKLQLPEKYEVLKIDYDRRYAEVLKELDEMLAPEADLNSMRTRKTKKKIVSATKAIKDHADSETDLKPAVNEPITADLPVSDPIVRVPMDERDKIYARLLIGEYLRTKFLEKALNHLGFANVSAWSWDEVKVTLLSEMNKISFKRKQFLLDCIEWNRLRNEVAHPVKLDFSVQEELNMIKASLGNEHHKRILDLLKRKGAKKAVSGISRLSGTGRPPGLVKIADTQHTISAIRVYEWIHRRIFLPFCNTHEICRVTLSLLEKWGTDMSQFNSELGVTAEDMTSIYELAKLRNKLAHPVGALKQIKDYLNAVFMEDDNFGPNILLNSHL